VALLLAGLSALAEAQPASSRRAAADAASNGLRQSHGGRGGRHSHRNADPVRFLCGTDLSNELARVCAGRGYNGHSGIGFRGN